MFLPDTNVLIYAFHGEEPFASLLGEWGREKTLIFSIVSVAEFMVGSTDEENDRLESLTNIYGILEINYEIGKLGAIYRRHFLRKQKKVFLLDCMLAATAKVHNCTLVTVNKSDFPMKDIKILDPSE